MHDNASKQILEYLESTFNQSQRQLALIVGISPSEVSRISTGKRHWTFEQFFQLADYFGLTPAHLLLAACRSPQGQLEFAKELLTTAIKALDSVPSQIAPPAARAVA